MHYVARVGLDPVKKRVLDDADDRRALYERLQFAMQDEPDPWHQHERAPIDERQYVPVASL